MLNIDLSHEMAWIKASLRLHAGGSWGTKSRSAGTIQLAPFSWHPLPTCPLLLTALFSCNRSFLLLPVFPLIPQKESAIAQWDLGHSEPPPSSPDAMRQRTWDSLHIVATYNALLEQVPDDQAKTHLTAVVCHHSV